MDASHTPHTRKSKANASQTQGEFSAEDALALAREKGYVWTREEAEQFLAYNRDRGRTDGWDYAAERWEEQRIPTQRYSRTP